MFLDFLSKLDFFWFFAFIVFSQAILGIGAYFKWWKLTIGEVRRGDISPICNVDGTPMIEGTCIDVKGHSYGSTSHF